MPRFLLLNYLEEVRKQHNFFLSQWLLTSPSHLETVDSYAHNGTLQDYGYRLPWLRVPDKDSLQNFANIEDVVADLQKLTNGISDVENPRFPTKSVVHIVHDDGEVSEIVPSSNPDSPPVDQELVVEMEKRRVDSSLEDFFQDSGTSQAPNAEGRTLLLPALMEPNLFQESLSKLPTLDTLCARLTPKAVPDPLTQNEMETTGKDLRYVCQDKLNDAEEQVSSNATELMEKENLVFLQESKLLEQPEILPFEEVLNEHPLHQFTPEERSHDVKDELNDQQTTGNYSFLKPAQNVKNLEEFKVSISPKKGLCALNSEGVRDRKKVTDTLLFESVVDERDHQPTQADVGDSLQMLEQEALTESEDVNRSLLSSAQEQEMCNMVWKKEKRFLDFPALRLQEPSMDSTVTNKYHQQGTAHQTAALDKLNLKTEKIALDSSLSWNPVAVAMPTVMAKVEDYRHTEEETGEKDCDDEIGQISNQDQEKVDLQQFVTWDQSDEAIPQEVQDHITHVDSEADVGGKHKDDSNISTKSLASDIPIKENQVDLQERTHGQQPASQPHQQQSDDITPPNKNPVTTKPTHQNSKEAQSTGQGTNPKDHASMDKVKAKSVNPLDDFLMLRTVPVKREASGNLSPKKQSKITKKVARTTEAKSQPITKLESKSKKEIQEVAVPEKNSGKRSKSKQLEVALTEPFLDILSKVEMSAQPVLNQLRKLGIISASYSLSSLTPDITRFLLKQHEKMQDTNKNKDDIEMKLRCLLQLHALITTADLITHCDLTTAILHLSAVQDKYSHILQGCMDNIRQNLYKRQCILHKEKVMHPKLLTIIRQISDWYKRKLNKDGGDNDPKILVIIRREARKLVEVVAEVLAIVQGITTATSESSQMMYDAVSKQLDTCNCLILLATQIGQDFPWALFSLVIEYEYTQASAWLELCQRQNIRHIAMKTIPATGGSADVKKGCQDGLLEDTEDTSNQSQGSKCLKLIASEDIIQCSQLLQLLESKYEIMLLERNYSKMINDSSSNKLYFADLIVDEQCGIVLKELHQLSEAHTVEPVVNRMTKLSLQYSVCWLILYKNKGKHTGYPLGGQTVNNLARLQATLTQFSIKNDGYEVKVLFANDLSQVAQLIQKIAGNAGKTTKKWNKTDWYARPWLTNTLSKHEKVLLQFPCLNAYSAQIMLTAAPLKKLLTMSLIELISTCPWIQHKTLQIFHSLAHGMQDILQPPPSQVKLMPHSAGEDKPPNIPAQTQPISSSLQAPSFDAAVGGINQQQHLQGTASGHHLSTLSNASGYVDEWHQDQTGHGYQCQRSSHVVIKQEDDQDIFQPFPDDNSQDMTALEFIGKHIKQEPGVESMQQSAPYHNQQILPKASYQNGKSSIDEQRAYEQQHDQRMRSISALSANDQQHYHNARSINELRANAQEHYQSVRSIGAPRVNAHQQNHSARNTDAPRLNANDEDHYQSVTSTDSPRANAQHYIQRVRSNDDLRANVQEHFQRGTHDDQQHLASASGNMLHRLQPSLHTSREDPSSGYRYPEQPNHFLMQYHQSHPQHHSQRQSSSLMESVPHSAYQQHMGQRDYQRQMVVMKPYSQDSAPAEVPALPQHPPSVSSRHSLPRYQLPNEWDTHRQSGRVHEWDTPRQGGRIQHQSAGDQSVPSSVELENKDDTFMDGYGEHDDLGFDAKLDVDMQQVPLTPSKKKRRLTYERVPGKKDGQTRLTFF